MTNRGLKIREAFRAKYGVDHPSQLPEVKEKIRKKRLDGAYKNVPENRKKTLKEKYGNENYVNIQKIKETKKQNYGDENYNNRKKMIETNISKYGMKVSLNTQKSTKERVLKNEIGFHSKKYLDFLDRNNIQNISQLASIKKQRKDYKIKEMLDSLFFGDRLQGKVLPLFKKEDYKGSEYNNNYCFQCNICGHQFEDNLYSGNIPRCLNCYPINRFHSKIEDEIVEYLTSIGITNIQRHNRSVLAGEEIDILLPDYNIGIECDGIIWHSEIFGKKDKKYHINKTEKANEKGIYLLHIWDWEWLAKQMIVKSIIANLLKKTQRTIMARKCNVIVLSDVDKVNFIEKNHLQGNDVSSIKLGLIYNGELVSCMTFSKSRFDKKYEYELSRFCNKLFTNVVGGSSKLFSYFLKNYNPSSIVSYCNRRYYNGNMYKKIGMKECGITPVSYYYFNLNSCVPVNRIQFQKHKLKTMLSVFDDSLSEWQNMQNNGYDRIWDCGNYKFLWEY